MQLKKILARKDGYTLVVGVALGLMLQSLLYALSYQWAAKLALEEAESGFTFGTSTGDWKNDYAVPVATFVFGVLLLEVILQICAYAFGSKKTSKGKK